jgi:hypothetical protein
VGGIGELKDRIGFAQNVDRGYISLILNDHPCGFIKRTLPL